MIVDDREILKEKGSRHNYAVQQTAGNRRADREVTGMED